MASAFIERSTVEFRFNNSQYFLPWRPISVSPIGIKSFFSEWGKRVRLSEVIWVGIACSVILILRSVINLFYTHSNK